MSIFDIRFAKGWKGGWATEAPADPEFIRESNPGAPF